MKIKIHIRADNAAFDDAPGIELARILRKLATTIEDGLEVGDGRPLMDMNGNKVGAFEVIE